MHKMCSDERKGHENFWEKKCKHFLGKILKKVVEKFFWEMCSDEFFLKHALHETMQFSIVFHHFMAADDTLDVGFPV